MPDNFFTTQYLFANSAPTSQITFYVLLGAYLLFILLAVLININKKMHQQLRVWLFNYFITIGVIGVLISFFRWQSISYVGSRFMMLLVVFTAIIWYFALVTYTLVKMPKEIKFVKDEEIYQKYLPKKKKKK